MPTRDRPQFVRQALWYFQRQDYPRKQLVVIDDGVRPVGDLLPDEDSVRYVRLSSHVPIGAKRNIGCEAAAGEVVAHFDDDDWMAPDRLRRQVEELYRSETDVCGLSPLRYFKLDSGDAFVYRRPDPESWVAPGSLVYRRSAWASRRFPDTDTGECDEFVRRFEPSRIHALNAPDLYIALLHPGNRSAVDFRMPGWERRPIDEVATLLEYDRAFYVRLRNGSLDPVQRPVRAPASITFAAGLVVFDGYGSMAEYALVGMVRAGAAVDVSLQSVFAAGLMPETRRILERSRPRADSPVLYYSWPQPDLVRFRRSPDLFIYTMVESSRVPKVWVDEVNRARCVIVPTRYMARAFRDSGVTAPVEFVHQGIDPDVYRYIARPVDRPLTTLIVAAVEERKHTQEGIAAWKHAFAGDRDARLIIKARFQYRNYEPDDPRITLVDDNEPTRGIAHWYRQADVLMALGNEGFGLPLVEGMATGLPTIALDAEGQSDTCEDAKGLLLPVPAAGYRPHLDPQRGDCGVRAYPSVEAVSERLRWVATHRDEARDMGRAASEWALANRNIWRHGPALLDVMERRMPARRALRRRTFMWVRSWGQACGIAEYTKYLVEHLPEAVAGDNAPDGDGAALVHLEHEDGLHEGDVQLSHEIARLRQRGARVAITEHTVTPATRSWEREADALVALTKAGTEQLRQKWPDKRVVHIPHGCHEYFPPRKTKREAVLGCFGFAGGHKGMQRLLDLQRAIPGSRLAVYSHTRGDPGSHVLSDHADGDRVRLVTTFLPPEEVATRLAAECDLLVFWYDQAGGVFSASGAVLIGLASGVPVMTSPTGWFGDLRDATYQPTDPVEGARRLLEDDELRQRLVESAHNHCRENSWERTAQRYRALWESLLVA
jgi:glycosyltransferase involved in cell wall biosynthesis